MDVIFCYNTFNFIAVCSPYGPVFFRTEALQNILNYELTKNILTLFLTFHLKLPPLSWVGYRSTQALYIHMCFDGATTTSTMYIIAPKLKALLGKEKSRNFKTYVLLCATITLSTMLILKRDHFQTA